MSPVQAEDCVCFRRVGWALMARRPASGKKVLSQANLASLGADRLAELLMETAGPALKRRLRLELAAEVGAADLAFELDKRLTALEVSRTRVSWRKRPALLTELRTLHGMIVARLAGLAPALVIVAGHDPLRDEGIAYAERLRQAGVVVELSNYEGMVHGFLSFADAVDQGKAAIEQVAAALRTAFSTR